VEQKFGFPINYYAYPKGRYNKKVLAYIKEAGYDLALTIDDGIIKPGSDPLRLPRVCVDRTHSFSEFRNLPTLPAIGFRKLARKYFFN
jgi:peptidoglycan/xylan/chitin deacetylase (PgdA/CDA1 family)